MLHIVNVPKVLHAVIAQVEQVSSVPVRLPSTIQADSKVYAVKDGANARSYTVELAYAPACDESNVCAFSWFTGSKGAHTPVANNKGSVRVQLAKGISGVYSQPACGASCAPPFVTWVQKGFTYAIHAQLDVTNPKSALVALANSAITGPVR